MCTGTHSMRAKKRRSAFWCTPPPDNYFFETVANPPELPVVGGEAQDDLPLDLRTHCTAGPRKQHIFSVTYPLDLRVRP
ncbi:hypothetical protein AVEN_181432-1 [Araneus ventricosus]|uniref:Uncharacterized protein n=1 Tax=Araneus ventricosus TaxID=182803 RepID=A0A4Y2R8F9_ARAVE|nr:hypothetical protein AVEN_181432-1 [Araneus ventricosus]